MNENNDYRPENEGYSNPDNLYHYNYRSQEDQGRHEAPAVSKKPSFWHKTGVKITALLLACAVVGGAAGYGGTALFVLLCEIGVLLSISRRANLN